MSYSRRRVFWVMADSLGVGALPDASSYGDEGANTLASIVRATGGLNCPELQCLGLANILDLPLWPGAKEPLASFGKMAEASPGKDTTTGHWEMAGVPLSRAFSVFPNGFPQELIRAFCHEAKLPGVLGNYPASGTEIIKQLGEEHIKSGKLIVYTSADSVFQVAAHEEAFGLQRLFDACQIARRLCDPYDVCRIIARPFLGTASENFTRTTNRHDYSVKPPKPTVLEATKQSGLDVWGVGKIPDIFAHQGFTREIPSKSNNQGMDVLLNCAHDDSWGGIVFVNLVDFDMNFGHRRNPQGYRHALEAIDTKTGHLVRLLKPHDLLILSADHGCDPTFQGTDHTREYAPLIVYRKNLPPRNLGIRNSFSDVAASIAAFLDVPYSCPGTSFL